MQDTITSLLNYLGQNESATKIMEKAQELSMVMGNTDESFWTNWIITKAPPSVVYSLAQQGISITTLGEAKAHIKMITQANQSQHQASSQKLNITTMVGSKHPVGEEPSNPHPHK